MPRGKPTQAQSRWGFVPTHVPAPFDQLTFRERQVAWHLCHGLSCTEISELCNNSTKTVDSHRGSVLDKLETKNAVTLTRIAIRVGFVTAHDPDACDCRELTENVPAELAEAPSGSATEHLT